MREVKVRAWDESRGKMQASPRWVEFRVVNGVVKAFNFNREGKEVELPVMQHTGLKDCNCVDIYFDDVVHVAGYGDLHVNDIGDLATLIDAEGEGDIENIIGNIHENPELMEKL